MSEIDRVFTLIDAFIDAASGGHCDLLAKVIGDCIEGAKRSYVSGEMEDQALVAKIDAVVARLAQLGQATDQNDLEALKRDYRDVAVEAMTCRRATLPLTPPGRPWAKLDPKLTLSDEEDMYSFAVCGTLADYIERLLRALEDKSLDGAGETNEEHPEAGPLQEDQ